MKLANHEGRAVLVVGEPGDERGVDVASASAGRFGPAPGAVLAEWAAFVRWAQAADLDHCSSIDLEESRLGPPSPEPTQIFAFGLNYADHAEETGFAAPAELPPVFPKWRSALAGPFGEVEIPAGGQVDWEVELVVVVGRAAHRVDVADAWDCVAGLTVGQDLSERAGQFAGPAPQFGLAKSHRGFAPTGPWLVTPDELVNRDDLALGCAIDDVVVQSARTRQLLHPVAVLIARLSEVVVLQPGDLIFTGTPDGVGMARTPSRFLRPGELLHTWVEGIGSMRHRLVSTST